MIEIDFYEDIILVRGEIDIWLRFVIGVMKFLYID